MSDFIKRLFREEEGMEFVEWALVAVLFALVGIGAWTTLGNQIVSSLGAIESDLAAATP
jgi:Flp pilus assembly pilin Flp